LLHDTMYHGNTKVVEKRKMENPFDVENFSEFTWIRTLSIRLYKNETI